MTTPSVRTSPATGPDGGLSRSEASTEPTPPGLGLAPLRAALLARARDAADELVAAAEHQRASALSDAQREVDELLSRARDQGRADGEELLASERAAGRASDQARLLAAQRSVYESLRSRIAHEVRDLLARPGAHDRLVAALVDRLGEDVAVIDSPDGGVVARTPDGRSIDASVAALVDSSLADQDLTPLWTPG
jgi:F0F1-type ATP synthase membrane subunit b/b'